MYDEYIEAVRTTILREKLFLQCQPCETRINNYMRHYREFWRANHDKQPCLDPFGMAHCILLYVKKGQKATSVSWNVLVKKQHMEVWI